MMKYNLEDLISKSGDSELIDYSYFDGILKIMLKVNSVGRNVDIRIRTECLSFNNSFLGKDELFRTCRIEILDLSNVLTVQNNIYIPTENFGRFMIESKSNFNLAYGKKLSEAKYIFTLVGYDRLISCLVRTLEDVSINDFNFAI